jgi:uncharacterized protein DUF4062
MKSIFKKSYPGVVISSTFNDLEKHRDALIIALQKEDLHPIIMETHIARTFDDVISSSLNMVENSTAYIGLISQRYGQVIEDKIRNPQGYSVTRLEYEKAKSLGLPIVIFIMHADHDIKIADIDFDEDKRQKLEDFRVEAKKGRIYNEFKNLESFSVKAVHLIAQLRREIEDADSGAEKNPVITEDDNNNAVIAPPALYAQPPYIGTHDFVGRAAELQQLNDWASPSEPHPVLLFEAIGGSGKSMLTWEWIKNHAPKTRTNWAGIFWYSFYERGAQMSDFCRHALAYINNKPFKKYEKKKIPELAELLLEKLRAKPWLFVLDGLERVLVAYNRIDAAEIPDEELNTPTDNIIDRDPRSAIKPEDDDLIHALASVSPSKILASSRLIPKILINPAGQPISGVQRISLPGLRPADAELLIRSCGVTGDSQKIQDYLSSHCGCHPLVTGVLAGLVIDYLPDKGNFDAWAEDSVIGGTKLNFGELDLIQKRNHILKAALKNLNSDCRQLLSTLSFLSNTIDYATLCAFSPHGRTDSKPSYNSKTAAQLQKTVKDLELRGFLQYDGKYYNLHPVVRGVVSGNLHSKERLKYGQKVVDYFSQKAHMPYEEADTLDDLYNRIHIVATLQKIGKFQEAVNIWRGGLSSALLFNIEAYYENLAIIKPFFPNSLNEISSIMQISDTGYIINDLALTMALLEKYNEAHLIYYSSLENQLNQKDWSEIRNTISSMTLVLNGMNKIGKEKQFHQWGIELSELIESKQDQFLARMFYFEYLTLIGAYEDAEKEWEYIDKFRNLSWERALYRPGTAEYLFSKFNFKVGKLKEKQIEQAEKLSVKGKNRQTIRDLLFVRGIWYIDQQKWDMAIDYLNKAIEMARAVGQVDVGSETLLALAKLKIDILVDPMNKAIELSKVRNPHHLFLAELFEAIGDKEKTVHYALLAYKKYWGEGEPYVDRYYLDRTKKLLHKMGVTPPVLPPYDPGKEKKHPVEAKLIKAIETLRKEKELKKRDQ